MKRSHPRLGGRQPIEATTGEEPDALDRERGRVRVLVVEKWEAETRSDASLISLHGKPQGNSGEWDLAWKKSSPR